MLKRVLILGLLCAIPMLARADEARTGAARVIENPTSNADLKLRVRVGSTPTDAIAIAGATGEVTVGAGGLKLPTGRGLLESSATGAVSANNVFTSTLQMTEADCTGTDQVCTTFGSYGGGLSTITHVGVAGTGTYRVNFTASFWSGPPVCHVMAHRGEAKLCVGNSTPTTSLWNIICFTSNTGVVADNRIAVTCTGPRL